MMGPEWDALGPGLVAGMLQKQIADGRSIGRWVGIASMVIGALGAVAFGGSMRGLGITLVLIGLIIVLVVALVRAMALGSIRRFATPTSIAEKRGVIDQTMETADIPRGPVSVVRFLYGVSKGAKPEVERLTTVMDDLRDDLAASEDEIERLGELEGRSTPELPE